MRCKLILVLCLHITSIYTAPMKIQILPLQYGMSQQFPQNLFRQNFPNFMQPQNLYPQLPMVLLLPNMASITKTDDRYIKLNEEHQNSLKSNTGHVDVDNDAIILDAEPNSTEDDMMTPSTVVMPNGARFSIGDIISYIPFLPIEINVPDTIGWIAGLFPSFPWFGRPGQKPENTKRFSNKGPMPLIILPAPIMQ